MQNKIDKRTFFISDEILAEDAVCPTDSGIKWTKNATFWISDQYLYRLELNKT